MPGPLARFQPRSNTPNVPSTPGTQPVDPAAQARDAQIVASKQAALQAENEELKRKAQLAQEETDSMLVKTAIMQVASEAKASNPEHVYKLHKDDYTVHRSNVPGAQPTVVLKSDPTKSPSIVLKPWFESEGKYLLGPSVPAGAGLGGNIGAPPPAPAGGVIDLKTNEGLTKVTRGLTNKMLGGAFSPGTVAPPPAQSAPPAAK
jgi:hypothetical protein